MQRKVPATDGQEWRGRDLIPIPVSALGVQPASNESVSRGGVRRSDGYVEGFLDSLPAPCGNDSKT